jgi:hypothetical protein
MDPDHRAAWLTVLSTGLTHDDLSTRLGPEFDFAEDEQQGRARRGRGPAGDTRYRVARTESLLPEDAAIPEHLAALIKRLTPYKASLADISHDLSKEPDPRTGMFVTLFSFRSLDAEEFRLPPDHLTFVGDIGASLEVVVDWDTDD